MLRYFVPNYNYPWHSIKFVVQLKKKSKNHLTKIRSVVRFLPSAPPPFPFGTILFTGKRFLTIMKLMLMFIPLLQDIFVLFLLVKKALSCTSSLKFNDVEIVIRCLGFRDGKIII